MGIDAKVRLRKQRRRTAVIRKRRIMIIVNICLVIAFGGYFGVHGDGISDSKAYAAEQTVYKTVTVYSGDTIWGIASEFTEASKDVRKQVKAICELNDVNPGKIYPGQTLLVPVPAHMA